MVALRLSGSQAFSGFLFPVQLPGAWLPSCRDFPVQDGARAPNLATVGISLHVNSNVDDDLCKAQLR